MVQPDEQRDVWGVPWKAGSHSLADSPTRQQREPTARGEFHLRLMALNDRTTGRNNFLFKMYFN
jgi:hypothetical protein